MQQLVEKQKAVRPKAVKPTAVRLMVIHSPTLDTILMVEDTIRDAKGVITVAELKRRLPRKVNHNTLKAILVYLQRSGKIEFTLDGVIWVFMPKEDLAAVLGKGRTWA